jgi:hypothetical protein
MCPVDGGTTAHRRRPPATTHHVRTSRRCVTTTPAAALGKPVRARTGGEYRLQSATDETRQVQLHRSGHQPSLQGQDRHELQSPHMECSHSDPLPDLTKLGGQPRRPPEGALASLGARQWSPRFHLDLIACWCRRPA